MAKINSHNVIYVSCLLIFFLLQWNVVINYVNSHYNNNIPLNTLAMSLSARQIYYYPGHRIQASFHRRSKYYCINFRILPGSLLPI